MVVPTPDGVRNPLVLAAAHLAGVGRVFTIGGAQAIAALAYGTATVPAGRQDLRPRQRLRRRGQAARVRRRRHRHGGRRVGDPRHRRRRARIRTGSRWTSSRRPSTTSSRRRSCCRPMRRCSTRWRRARSGRSPRCRGGRSSRRRSPTAARWSACATSTRPARVANRVAPEHLELAVADPAALLPKIRHAGAIFMGHHASEALGDYCAGPNHVLPTGRTARFSSPLGVYDFQKRSSVLGVPAAAAEVLGQVAATLADGEGLPAHAQSARYRRGRAMNDRMPAAAGTTRSAADVVAAVGPAGDPRADRVRGRQGRGLRSSSTPTRTRSRCPTALRARIAAAVAANAVQPLSRRRRRCGDRRAARSAEQVPDVARDAARQRLRRADRDHHLDARAPGRRDARAGADVRHVPDERALRRHALRRRAARRGPRRSTSTRCSRRSSASARRWSSSPRPTTRPASSTDRGQVARIVRAAPGLVVLDEAYSAFAGRDVPAARRRSSRTCSCCARCRRSAWRRCGSATRWRRRSGSPS